MLSLTWFIVAACLCLLAIDYIAGQILIKDRPETLLAPAKRTTIPPRSNLIDDDYLNLLARRFLVGDMRRRQRITFAQYIENPAVFDQIANIIRSRPVTVPPRRHLALTPERIS